MSRIRGTSLLYDPEISVSQEQLQREIDLINAELGNLRTAGDETRSPRSRDPYTRRDSGIASSRRTSERPRQSNVPYGSRKYKSC